MASSSAPNDRQPITVKMRAYVCSFTLLGIAFWLPDILIHAVMRQRFGGIAVAIVSIVLPAAALLTLVWLVRGKSMAGSVFLHSCAGLFAIWLMGPLMMTCSATFSGGGFASGEGAVTAGLGTLLFPLFTLSMSVYDGSCMALFLATVLLPLAGWLLRHAHDHRA